MRRPLIPAHCGCPWPVVPKGGGSGRSLSIGFEAFGEGLEERLARLTSNKKETPPGRVIFGESRPAGLSNDDAGRLFADKHDLIWARPGC